MRSGAYRDCEIRRSRRKEIWLQGELVGRMVAHDRDAILIPTIQLKKQTETPPIVFGRN